MKFLITGGTGFIGSALVRHLIGETEHVVVNLDKLTYAANPMSLAEIDNSNRYVFERGDICDSLLVSALLARHKPDIIIHLAAESHVDRSIDSPGEFVHTNVVGTLNLLEQSIRYYETLSESGKRTFRFHHVSTDEVFGDLSPSDPPFSERNAYDPSSPYSASKAASDHLVRAWYRTYGLPVVLTNCSNNYGPCQFPEKLIPLMILNSLRGKRLPVYGDGLQIRDWLYVEDHARALVQVATSGVAGETYCIGGNSERTNREVIEAICAELDVQAPNRPTGVGAYIDLIEQVADRPGHDRRYAIDCSKVQQELGWEPVETFESGLRKTVAWYLKSPTWWQAVADGSYLRWLESAHGSRNYA